jgi:selenocysteine-specific elongation factor
MHVVATAGHVDHGKSTLVRALTGTDPDRLAEERRRGLTIELGFAWTTLPDGAPLAFVDVPGHERFMTTMLAGVGPVPAVLFVVAADAGWRTQSDEHLSALDAFGVRHGVLAITRADLADPEPVAADARARLARTTLGEVEAVAVSAPTGTGLPALRAALQRMVGRLPAPDRTADVRLWVDRAFTVAGHGTVVTGTLGAGTLRVGDQLELGPSGQRVRVRGLESLKRRVEAVEPVARVAVNLRGATPGSVRRGHTLQTPGRWLACGTVDGALTGPFPAPELPGELVLHAGSAAVPVQVRPLGDAHARLTLAHPLPLRVGDVALLRDPARQLVVGRVTLLDVRPPPLRARGAAARRTAELAESGGRADAAAELRRRRLVRRGELVAMGVDPVGDPVVDDWMADPDWWCEQRTELGRAVEAYGAEHPLDPGMPEEVARQVLGLPHQRLVEALVRTPGRPPVASRGGRLYGSRSRPTLPEPVAAAVAEIRADLAAAPFAAPDADRLAELGLTPRLLAAAVEAGELLRVADGVYLLPGADREAAGRLARLTEPFTLSEARQLLGTTRRVAVPLLELLDRLGWTERVDSTRRRLRAR